MANPAMPTVPQAAGVPPVATGSTIAPTVTPVSAASATSVTQAKREWAVYYSGTAQYALQFDSLKEIEDRLEWNIPKYPIENGGFQNYNKVQLPKEVQLIATKANTTALAKSDFTKQVYALSASLKLLTIITPDETYTNMNLVYVSKERSADSGASLLQFRLGFSEVRLGVVTAFTQVTVPKDADNISGGAVQTQTATPSQTPGTDPQ